MKRLRILLALAVGVLAAGCYNDFDTPAPKKLFTDEDMTVLGLEHVTIKEVKEMFESKCGGLSGTGTNSDFASTRTLKFGTKTTDEKDFEGLYEWPEASNFYIKGKVISSDRQGNIYKSLHIYDGTAAIELKLYSGLFMDFYLDLEDMISQWVYVRLDGLYLGNYRMMLSIGGAPSDGYNTAGRHKFYANSNLDDPKVASLNVFAGEKTTLDESDILEVDENSYETLLKGEKNIKSALGRLIRFKNVKVRYAGVKDQDGNVPSMIKNGSYTNPYPSWIVTDWGDAQFGTWYYWAYNRNNVRLYGSVMISYVKEEDGEEKELYTSDPGIYTVRTSGYSQFAMKPIPKNGAVGTVLGIFSIYSQKSDFKGGSYDYAQYQISVSRLEDLDFPESSLLTEEWIEANTPAESLKPPVKVGGDDYENE